MLHVVVGSLITEKADSDDDEESDDDIAVGGGTQNTTCPLCIKLLTHPMRSDLCNHPVCQKCFLDYLGQKKTLLVECPYSGCDSRISQAMMEFDKAVAAQIKRAQRQEARRAEREETQSGGEEVQEDEEEEAGDGTEKKPTQKRARSQRNGARVVVADSDDE